MRDRWSDRRGLECSILCSLPSLYEDVVSVKMESCMAYGAFLTDASYRRAAVIAELIIYKVYCCKFLLHHHHPPPPPPPGASNRSFADRSCCKAISVFSLTFPPPALHLVSSFLCRFSPLFSPPRRDVDSLLHSPLPCLTRSIFFLHFGAHSCCRRCMHCGGYRSAHSNCRIYINEQSRYFVSLIIQ